MHTYRSVNDMEPEITSMTKEVYSKMMKGLKYYTTRRPIEAVRRSIYKTREKGKMQRLTQECEELTRQLQEARQTIITLQGKLLQLTADQGRMATTTTSQQLLGLQAPGNTGARPWGMMPSNPKGAPDYY